jgi:hypothetical protein
MPTNKEIEGLVCKHYGETAADCVEGRYKLGGYDAWRVWTQGGGQGFEAHYVFAKGARVEHLSDFGALVNWLPLHVKLGRSVDDELKKDKQDLESVPLVVAAFVVLIAMGLLVYVVWADPKHTLPVGWLLTTVVGAAAGFLFSRLGGKPQAQPGPQ